MDPVQRVLFSDKEDESNDVSDRSVPMRKRNKPHYPRVRFLAGAHSKACTPHTGRGGKSPPTLTLDPCFPFEARHLRCASYLGKEGKD